LQKTLAGAEFNREPKHPVMNKQLSNDSLLDYAPVTFLVNQF
jgi:hypothetical protein